MKLRIQKFANGSLCALKWICYDKRSFIFANYFCLIRKQCSPFSFFFFLAGIAALTALLLRTQKKHMQLLLDQRDDVLTFRPDGTLVVERPSGETLTFPVASEQQVPLERGFRRYSNGKETYVTCLAMLEPVEGPEEAEVVSHA